MSKLSPFICGSASLALLICFLITSGVFETAAAADPLSSTADPAPLVPPSEQQSSAPAVEPENSLDCREVITLLRRQQSLVTRETGQLKRELAALRQDISKPGITEVVAGIGYIFGLAGVGLYVQSRKRRDS